MLSATPSSSAEAGAVPLLRLQTALHTCTLTPRAAGQVPTLHSLCCDVVSDALLTLGNAPQLLLFADQFQVEPLRQRVLAFCAHCWVAIREAHDESTLRDALGDETFEAFTAEQAATDRKVRRDTLLGQVVERPAPAPEPPPPLRTSSGRVTYPYEHLRTGAAWPPGVGVENREGFLADDEFDRVFGMARSAYAALPSWKRAQLRQKADLF